MKYRVLKPIPGRLGVWTIGKLLSAAIMQRDGYDVAGLLKEQYIEVYDPEKSGDVKAVKAMDR